MRFLVALDVLPGHHANSWKSMFYCITYSAAMGWVGLWVIHKNTRGAALIKKFIYSMQSQSYDIRFT